MVLMTFDPGTEVAGVFTRSRCPSAAVDFCRRNLTGGKARACAVNVWKRLRPEQLPVVDDGHLRGFAFADADPSLSVTDHHEGAKIEPLAALDDLRNTVDENDFVFEA